MNFLKKIRVGLICAMYLVMGAVTISGQTFEITGKVTSTKGTAIAGAGVALKNKGLKTTTDASGNYSLKGEASSLAPANGSGSTGFRVAGQKLYITLERPQAVKISLHYPDGKYIHLIASQNLPAGEHQFSWGRPKTEFAVYLIKFSSDHFNGLFLLSGNNLSQKKGSPLLLKRLASLDELVITAQGYRKKTLPVNSYKLTLNAKLFDADCAMDPPHQLKSKAMLKKGEFLCSENGEYKFGVTPVGDLRVLEGKTIVWMINQESENSVLLMREDGNMVMGPPGKVRFGSLTSGNAGAELFLENTGRVHVKLNGSSLWDAGKGDLTDFCPDDPAKMYPGMCGCGNLESSCNSLIHGCRRGGGTTENRSHDCKYNPGGEPRGNFRIKYYGGDWISIGCKNGKPVADNSNTQWERDVRSIHIKGTKTYLDCPELDKSCRCKSGGGERFHGGSWDSNEGNDLAHAIEFPNGGPVYNNNANETCVGIHKQGRPGELESIWQKPKSGGRGQHRPGFDKQECPHLCLGDKCPD